jgi:uncharacterized membrane protein YoaT (DUF817 family)
LCTTYIYRVCVGTSLLSLYIYVSRSWIPTSKLDFWIYWSVANFFLAFTHEFGILVKLLIKGWMFYHVRMFIRINLESSWLVEENHDSCKVTIYGLNRNWGFCDTYASNYFYNNEIGIFRSAFEVWINENTYRFDPWWNYRNVLAEWVRVRLDNLSSW